jgi:hypothetical protein
LCSRFEISVSNLITISPPKIHIPPSRRLREINQTKPYPPHLGTFEFESDYHRHRWIRLFSSCDVPWWFFIQPLISSGGVTTTTINK